MPGGDVLAVMAGLVPAIHVAKPRRRWRIGNSRSRNGFASCPSVASRPDVDGRDKPGHDGTGAHPGHSSCDLNEPFK